MNAVHPNFPRDLSKRLFFPHRLWETSGMLKVRISLIFLLALALAGTSAFAQNVSDRFYQSVRNDDLATLRSLVKEYGADSKDSLGQTPLMFAAAFGSLEAMKLLISSGADAKAESEAGVTALPRCSADSRRRVALPRTRIATAPRRGCALA